MRGLYQNGHSNKITNNLIGVYTETATAKTGPTLKPVPGRVYQVSCIIVPGMSDLWFSPTAIINITLLLSVLLLHHKLSTKLVQHHCCCLSDWSRRGVCFFGQTPPPTGFGWGPVGSCPTCMVEFNQKVLRGFMCQGGFAIRGTLFATLYYA